MAFKFPVINPLLHNELRLKIMVALDSLDSADFVYLCAITDSTRGNLSVQIKTLQEALTNKAFGKCSLKVCQMSKEIKNTEKITNSNL